MGNTLRVVVAVALLLWGAGSAQALVWVSDDDGDLGQVNPTNGQYQNTVNIKGSQVWTDIAYAPDGTMYATTFTDLYKIDTSHPASAPLHIATLAGISGSNALAFDAQGHLYLASDTATKLWAVNPTNGALTVLVNDIKVGNTHFSSSGDLAVYEGSLFLTANVSGQQANPDHLIRFAFGGPGIQVIDEGVIMAGATKLDTVYGLATDDDGKLYGVSYADKIYRFDNPASNANVTLMASINRVPGGTGGNLDGTYGATSTDASALDSIVPEPATFAVWSVLGGLAAVGVVLKRRRRAA